MHRAVLHVRRLLPCGAGAVLIECADAADALRLWQWLADEPPPGVEEAVPGARTVLVRGAIDGALGEALLSADGAPGVAVPGHLVVVPVRYDGADLEEVAARCGLTPAEVSERHRAPEYTVAFGGFAPGFAYLTGLDPLLRLPRRPSPRTRVPAGAVAIADEYAGVYPSATPGGWHLLGSTDLTMFDLDRDPAATLRPGLRVRFEEAR